MVILLHDPFKYYYHDPNSKDWSPESYIEIMNLKSFEDYWAVDKHLYTHIKKGMFFIMRKNIFPLWDVPENMNGTFITFKIRDSDAITYWNEICGRLLTNNILTPEYSSHWQMINGLSISPKKEFCVIKIWIGNKFPEITDDNVIKIFKLSRNYEGLIMIKKNEIII